MKDYMKSCPGCEKEVPDWEVECTHCGEWLDKEKKPDAKFESREEYEKWKAERIKKSKELKEAEPTVQPVDKTNKILKISIAFGILLVSFAVGYYYIVHLPQKESQEQLNKEQIETENQGEIHEELLKIRKEREKLENIQKQYIEEERLVREREEILRSEELRIEMEAEEENREIIQTQSDRKARTSKCLADAHERYFEKWKESCLSEGLETNCLLPGEIAKDIDNAHEQDRIRCESD